MKENTVEIFLGANSADGFINRFTSPYNAKDNWKCYIIKGGPGTGKSSFMKKVANKAVKLGEQVTVCPCSSDPDSLDAVILHKRKKVVLDGTAPHIVDPKYPGVCEQILNFGDFWNEDVLTRHKDDIIRLTDENKLYHTKASKYLSALGRLIRDDMRISLIACDIEKTVNFAQRLAHKVLKQQNKAPAEEICFLNAVTPKGNVFFKDTIEKYAQDKVVINDEYGTVSGIILSVVRDIALSLGYSIITVKNNILPSDKTDCIIVKEANVAFCTDNIFTPIDSDRKIRITRFTDKEVMQSYVKRLRFNKKLEKELLESATDTIAKAKAVHDSLEECYKAAMDYTALDKYCNTVINNIFNIDNAN